MTRTDVTTNTQTLFHFAFNDDLEVEESVQTELEGVKDVEFKVQAGGLVNGVVVWFELQLDDTTMLSTHPERNTTHWQQTVRYFRPRKVRRGDTVAARAVHNGVDVQIDVAAADPDPDQGAASISQLASPQWLAFRQQVDRLGGEIFGVLARDPSEQAQASAKAQVFAAQAAMFGLDTRDANNLARSLAIRF